MKKLLQISFLFFLITPLTNLNLAIIDIILILLFV